MPPVYRHRVARDNHIRTAHMCPLNTLSLNEHEFVRCVCCLLVIFALYVLGHVLRAVAAASSQPQTYLLLLLMLSTSLYLSLFL